MYEPELGQMAFGNAYTNLECPSELEAIISAISVELGVFIDKKPNYDGQYIHFESDIFDFHPYYWGECTCGYEEKLLQFEEENNHTESCFHTAYSKLKIHNTDWLKDLAILYDQFGKDTKKKNWWYGCATICTCDYTEKWNDFITKNAHDVLCPIVRANFWYKPLNLKVYWYKHIGRGMTCNKLVSSTQLLQISKDCTEAISKKLTLDK